MLVILLACAGKPEAAPPPSTATTSTTPPAPPTATGSLPPSVPSTGKTPPPCPKLESSLWPHVADAAPVQVVVEWTAPVALPASFVKEAEGTGTVQGRIPGTELCALAATEGVGYVRAPFTPAPKVP